MGRVIHVGLWKIKKNAPSRSVQEVYRRVAAFKSQIPGILESHAGGFTYFELPKKIVETYGVNPDVSVLARGYNAALYVVFESEKARRFYDEAQPHLDLADYLLPLLENGMEEVINFDLVIPSA